MTPPPPAAAVDPCHVLGFLDSLAPDKVRRILAADPLGTDYMLRHPEAHAEQLRLQAFDVLSARPRFFAQVCADQEAADAEAFRQLSLF